MLIQKWGGGAREWGPSTNFTQQHQYNEGYCCELQEEQQESLSGRHLRLSSGGGQRITKLTVQIISRFLSHGSVHFSYQQNKNGGDKYLCFPFSTWTLKARNLKCPFGVKTQITALSMFFLHFCIMRKSIEDIHHYLLPSCYVEITTYFSSWFQHSQSYFLEITKQQTLSRENEEAGSRFHATANAIESMQVILVHSHQKSKISTNVQPLRG